MPAARSLRSLTTTGNRTKSPGPPSPTFTETTNVSAMNFGPDGPSKIITRSNLKASLQGYEDLLSKSASYRAALLNMSRATAAFADAMEICASLKGPSYESGTRLQAASGLHHLMGNHWHLLAETLDKQVEKPLRSHLETYKSVVHFLQERSATYEKALRERSNIIRQTEMGNMKKKGRNLQTFREALAILQRQVDELDDLKSQHYQEILEHEEEAWDVVQGKVCIIVRSTLDVFDRFTSKASDPVIEPMLQVVPDPFDSYGPPPSEDKIFSILPPLSVIANAPSSSPSPLASSNSDLDNSSDGIGSVNGSWVQSSGGYFSDASAAWVDAHASPYPSSPPSTPSRSTPSSAASPPSNSPPSALHRRHSHPTNSPTHHLRKSESKLRSVLSVIDEIHPRPNGDLGEGGSRSTSESSRLSASSFTATAEHEGPADSHNEDQREDVRAKSKEPPDSLAIEDDTTPRNSVIRPQTISSESALPSRSPRSDETVLPPS